MRPPEDHSVLSAEESPASALDAFADYLDEAPGADAGAPAENAESSAGAPNPEPGTPNPEPAARSTDFQLAEWQRRLELVHTCLANRVGERGGLSANQIARTTGEPAANLSRYLRAYREAEAALPGSGSEALKPGVSTGRPLKFILGPEETRALRLEVLKRNSLLLAVEWFPRNPACAPATRALILQELDKSAREQRPPCWPSSLRRAGAVTDEERALFRGEKSFQNLEHCDRKGQFYIDEAGAKILMAPNVLWESDDMSVNEPFRFTCPETGALKVGRQTLNTIDVFSAFWVAGQPLGRPRDAYRVEDIADHMLGCCEAHGLPLHWRLERGVWENDFVKGVKLSNPQSAIPNPQSVRWGGLSALFRVHFTWKSRGKGTVESSFNLLQDLMAHASTSIGRVRGEFERATQLFLKAQNGDPEAAAHFWDIASCADGLVAAMIAFNQRPKKRRAHGKAPVVPADLFQSAPRREIPPAERWRFCPVKREATVRQGHIECVVPHYPLPFRFVVNGVHDGQYFAHGHRVLLAFHPGRPEEGCHVFNAEDRSERNRDGYKFAEHLLCAPLALDAPQFDLSPAERALHARKNASAAVRSEFRALTKAGAKIVRRAETRDGYGNRTANFSSTAPSSTGVSPVGPAVVPTASPKTRPPDLEPDHAAERARLDALDAADLARGALILS